MKSSYSSVFSVLCGLTLVPMVFACGGDDGPATGPVDLIPDPAVSTECLATSPAAGVTRAKYVVCADELPAGRLVSGRTGDIVIANSMLTAVIRTGNTGYYLPNTGAGGIVDLARRGGEDQVKEIIPVAELNGGSFEEIVITEAGDDGPATVVVRGPIVPVPLVAAAIAVAPVNAIIEQRYILEADATEIRIETVLFPNEGAEGSVTIGEAMFFGGRVISWLPGTGIGEGTANAEFIASYATTSSYGIGYPADGPASVRFVDIANIKLALGTARTLGNLAPVIRYFIVGDGSASSVTARAWELRGIELGTVVGTTSPNIEVLVTDAADAPITVARSDNSGAYSISLPPGSYTLTPTAITHTDGTPASVTITAGQEVTQNLVGGGSGTLTVTAHDDNAQPLPARITITPAQGGERRVHYTDSTGTTSVALPPGNYHVSVSRGMEYDAFVSDPTTISDGQTTSLEAELAQVVDTAGWVSMDTHLHSEMSTDSQISLEDRLLAVAAEGVDIAVSTDHDFITDYQPVIDDLGLASWLLTKIGVETSSVIWGHVNSWPHTPDYDEAAGGAFPWYGKSPGEVFAMKRARTPAAVVQVNHPASDSSGLFNLIDWDPINLVARRDPKALGLDGKDLNDMSVDAIEVGNDLDESQFTPAFAAWLAMVTAGHPAAATASSDSHGKTTYSGNSRTYVYVGAGADTIASIDLADVDDGIRERRVVVAQGSFLTAAIVDPNTDLALSPGQKAVLPMLETTVTLEISLRAAAWMPMASIEIYAGTDLAQTISLDANDTAPQRYQGRITLPVTGMAGLFVVVARPAGRGDPVIGMPNASFTNPLEWHY